MKIRIRNEYPIFDYKQFCLITQGKIISKATVPENTTEWWIHQIVANHSTIRCINFRIIDEIPRSCIMQIIRATKGHPQPEVASSRPDWNDGKERSNNPYETKVFAVDYTPESFIEMCKQRLCTRTEPRTRHVIEGWVEEMKKSEDPLIKAIGYCCYPACDYINRCPEIKSCGRYPKLADRFIELMKNQDKTIKN